MKKLFIKPIIFILLFSLPACLKRSVGNQTVVLGHVSDKARGINISGYKIVLIKSWRECRNFACGWVFDEVGTAYTNSNGDYSIVFNYKLKEGESYTIQEQYYGNPYYPEIQQLIIVERGLANVVDINAWKPVVLKLNLEVLNNTSKPLMVGNKLTGSEKFLFNTENIYEQNIKKTYNLKTKPGSDIKILFWYLDRSSPYPILHQKEMLYHTPLDYLYTLDIKIDCSTF